MKQAIVDVGLHCRYKLSAMAVVRCEWLRH